ncbi:MAG: lysozyme [Hespellia sp.]|nr:lysozyme [Hespellia sp.]
MRRNRGRSSRDSYLRLILVCCVILACVAILLCRRFGRNPEKDAAQDQIENDSEGKENQEEQKDERETLHFIHAWGEWHDMVVDLDVKQHGYDWSCLTNTEEGISYTGDARYTIRKGVDVSRHQGKIDWERVKADGYDFAILRIGYREYGSKGALHVDEMFHENMVGAKRAGLDVGVYLFSQAIDEEETLEEVELVLNNLKDYELEFPVAFDPERIRDDDARTDSVEGEQFTQNTVLFCEKVKEAGYQPMVYSNMIWEAFEFDMKALKDYPIWYADYGPIPQTPYDFTFWQYSEKGTVDGIEGLVDVNVQFCGEE